MTLATSRLPNGSISVVVRIDQDDRIAWMSDSPDNLDDVIEQ